MTSPGSPLDAAVILAGGAGRRMGADKPALVVGGRTLLDTALAAVGGARVVVVGPFRELPVDVLRAREDPPGGGPAAALVAGLAALTADPGELVAVLAADLPGVSASLLNRLTRLLVESGREGALAVDAAGHRQLLLGVWRAGPLSAAVATRPSWHGGRLSDLLRPLDAATLAAAGLEIADVDTPEDLARWRPEPPA